MPSFLSSQVTPQGGAGTLPLSQASSSLSTTGQGGQKLVGVGWKNTEQVWGSRVAQGFHGPQDCTWG